MEANGVDLALVMPHAVTDDPVTSHDQVANLCQRHPGLFRGIVNLSPLWSEQDPADWWEGAKQSIRHVLAQPDVNPGEISAIGLTGQMHGLVLLDSQGEILRPAMLWNDQRTGEQCDEIRR